MLPYCINGISRQRIPLCSSAPLMNRNALNGRTNAQKIQSAKHKLWRKGEIILLYIYLSVIEEGLIFTNVWKCVIHTRFP